MCHLHRPLPLTRLLTGQLAGPPTHPLTLPLTNALSDQCLLFKGYMLEVDPNRRPNIHQVAYVAFKITGKTCCVPNTQVPLFFFIY